MFFKILREIGRPQWLDIIRVLKRSTGMSVAEIAQQLKMSYMGVKQHCVELEKKGYLDTWRRPKAVGRPEKAYRLTKKVDPIFPQIGNELTLDLLNAIQQTYGGNSAERLLFGFFTRKTQYYTSKVKGKSVVERSTSLAKLRDLEGYMSLVENDAKAGFRIVEYHSLFNDIAKAYPTVHRMEETMFSRVLVAPVRRAEERASGLARFTFYIDTLGKAAATVEH
ncbi:MAG: winged helix-turn-helix transcriptional regulator [Verrucomicrobiales bacterium]